MSVQIERVDEVMVFTINRPEARNAFTMEMYQALADGIAEITIGSDISAAVIMGAGGKAFAAGTDMREFEMFSKPEHAITYEQTMEGIISTIEKCPVPVIAALTGACTGGGAAIACACDFRIADVKLKFGVPIARTLGNCLSISNIARISRVIGEQRMKDIMLSSRLIEADEALQTGLVREVCATAEEAVSTAMALAKELATHAPLTMMATKEAFRRMNAEGIAADDHDLITLCYMSDDFKEGREAFLAKRKPAWTAK